MGDGKCSNPNKYFKGCTYFYFVCMCKLALCPWFKDCCYLTRPGQVRLLVVSDWIGYRYRDFPQNTLGSVSLYSGDIIVWYFAHISTEPA